MASQINTVDSQILKDAKVLSSGMKQRSNSPPLPKNVHSSQPTETSNQKDNVILGGMAVKPASHSIRQPLEKISPTPSGELPAEDEADSPTPSSTASEPITDQFSPVEKTSRPTNHRGKDSHLRRSPQLKKFGAEDGRTTDEEDVEGARDDAFSWPTHSTYDEQR